MTIQVERFFPSIVTLPDQSPYRPLIRAWPICIFGLFYLVGILASTVILTRSTIHLPGETWIAQSLLMVGSYLHLPADLHLAQNRYASQQLTNFSEFLLVLVSLFTLYVLSAFYIQKQKEDKEHASYLSLLLIVMLTMFFACIYVFTPATISADVYSYAAYGRILQVYHANPYFVPPLRFPHDPIFPFVYWKNIVAIYGPVWLIVCASLTALAGKNPMNIFITFRAFASIMHFINIILVYYILRDQGYSKRNILSGTLLYAWNPLVLFESSLGGHNDVFMLTFVLIGVFAAIHAEKRSELRIRYYIPSLIMFTMAVLVKFTIAPIVILFILMIFFKKGSAATPGTPFTVSHRRSALSSLLLASSICIGAMFLFYALFWLGHSLKDITSIFSSQPEATFVVTSVPGIVQTGNDFHLLQTLAMLSSLHLWNIVTYGGMALVLLLGSIRLYRTPNIQNVILTTLSVLSVFLLTTLWFMPWYVIWIVGLAVIYPPLKSTGRRRWGLFILTLTFSLSASLTYYYNFVGIYYLHTSAPHIINILLFDLAAFLLPILAFLVCLACNIRERVSNFLLKRIDGYR